MAGRLLQNYRGYEFRTWYPRYNVQSRPNEYHAANFDACDRMNSSLALANAKEQYLSALQLTIAAIQNPETVSSDTTLLSSLLLDLFEKMTGSVSHSKSPWVSHVNGAFRLVQIRGREQFKRPLGIKLLVRLCTGLLITCVASYQPIPSELIQLRAAVGGYIDSNDPKWKLMGLFVRFVELRQASEGSSVMSSPRHVLDMAKCLDDDLVALGKEIPPTWQFETIPVRDSSERVYGDCYHIYRDTHVTQAWNVLRMTRISIFEIVSQHQQKLSDQSTPIVAAYLEEGTERGLADYTTDLKAVIRDICASVPQYTIPAAEMLDSSHESSGKKIYTSCYTLILPLFVVGQSSEIPFAIKQWTFAQLRFMSQDLGIRNAQLVLDILEKGKRRDPWSVYAMLGGYAFGA